MNTEAYPGIARRAAVHAALADPARLRVVDALALGDASPSELAGMLGMASNLLAHHLNVLVAQDVVARHRSEGDRRRSYVRLVPGALAQLLPAPALAAERVLFVCTGNSARSQLAAALWRQASAVPSASAGTHPADRVNPGALAVARRRNLPLADAAPRRLLDVARPRDFVVTVCDRAHEELPDRPALHWSVPDPVPAATSAAFEDTYNELSHRVGALSRHLAPA